MEWHEIKIFKVYFKKGSSDNNLDMINVDDLENVDDDNDHSEGGGGGQNHSLGSTTITSGQQQQQHRANTTMHVCWHRNISVSSSDNHRSIINQLSGYLLRKFKNSNGWQKLWVVFTNFCLFFYKTYQVSSKWMKKRAFCVTLIILIIFK